MERVGNVAEMYSTTMLALVYVEDEAEGEDLKGQEWGDS